MDREAWRAVINGVAKSRTRLSDWTELNQIKNIELLIKNDKTKNIKNIHLSQRDHIQNNAYFEILFTEISGLGKSNYGNRN